MLTCDCIADCQSAVRSARHGGAAAPGGDRLRSIAQTHGVSVAQVERACRREMDKGAAAQAVAERVLRMAHRIANSACAVRRVTTSDEMDPAGWTTDGAAAFYQQRA